MKLRLTVLTLVLASLLAVPTAAGFAASPPQPTYGAAVVDGDIGEWDLSGDFFADMYRAGNVNKEVESKLYLRYECSTETLFAFVQAVEGVPIIVNPADDAFVKIDGSKVVDASYASFAWVGQGYGGDNNHAEGWEASFPLGPQASYQINVHSNVFDDGESQTSAVADRNIDLTIFCAPDPSAVSLASFGADTTKAGVVIKWETANEWDNLGYNLYRATEENGRRAKVNENLIAAQALGGVSGASYEFVDNTIMPATTYYYWLEDVSLAGETSLHGPVIVETPGLRRIRIVRPRLAPSTPRLGVTR